MRTHHGIYDAVLEKDEEKDHDRERDLKKSKLTLTECFLALILALTCVSLHAVFLGKYSPFRVVIYSKGENSFTNHDTVEQIEWIVTEEKHVSDSFMGLVRITRYAHMLVN